MEGEWMSSIGLRLNEAFSYSGVVVPPLDLQVGGGVEAVQSQHAR